MTAKKVAWITGGGTGIGLGGAQALARGGWHVVISGRRAEIAEAAASTLRGDGLHVSAMALDVADADAVDAAVKEILGTHGRIDLLVNSAGINVPKRSWGDFTREGWDSVVDFNLNGVVYCIRAVLPAMRAQKSGTIINVASWAGRFVSQMTGPAYTATKHAVVALTQSLNMDEFKNGIRACALSPGEVATPILKSRPVVPSAEEQAKMLQIDDMGRTIAFIADMPAHVCINEVLISPTWNRLLA